MKNALILPLLLSCLSCSKQIVYVDREVCSSPSEALLEQFPLPVEPVTYQDYIVYKVESEATIKKCNARFDSIKMEYSNEFSPR